MAIGRPGVCVAVSDLEKTTLFYESLFDQAVERSTDKFVAFDVNGAQFSLLHESGYSFPLARGNNAIPNFVVDDIDAEFQRVAALGPRRMSDSVVSAGPVRLFMFEDPDGNVIEFYQEG